MPIFPYLGAEGADIIVADSSQRLTILVVPKSKPHSTTHFSLTCITCSYHMQTSTWKLINTEASNVRQAGQKLLLNFSTASD